MKWTDNGGGSDFKPAPAGTHVARCYQVIDLGTRRSEYQGKESFHRECFIGWELPNELMEEGEKAGQPFSVGKFYKTGLGEKYNLRAHLESWRGRPFTKEELAGFDARNILGKPCMVSVQHTEKGKAKVIGVSAMVKGLKCPDPVNEPVFFSMDEFTQESFDAISKGFQDMVKQSPEWAELHAKPTAQPASKFDDMEDDVPF